MASVVALLVAALSEAVLDVLDRAKLVVPEEAAAAPALEEFPPPIPFTAAHVPEIVSVSASVLL